MRLEECTPGKPVEYDNDVGSVDTAIITDVDRLRKRVNIDLTSRRGCCFFEFRELERLRPKS